MVYRSGLVRYPQTNYKTEQFFVAYIDILGTKELICNDFECKFLNKLNMFCEDAHKDADSPNKFFVKIFSDNILIAAKVSDVLEKNKETVAELINTVAQIQNEILRYGYLTRGAIVQGEFFHNEMFVYGRALVEAVKIEENIAIYPRVIVSDDIYNLCPNGCERCADGYAIVNQFLYTDTFEHLEHKNSLLKLLNKYMNNQKVKQKIMWIISYFNQFYKSPLSGILDKPQITEKEISNATN